MAFKSIQLAAALIAMTASMGAHAQVAAEKLPTGVEVVHTTKGTGASPQATSRVEVHYAGTLLNGTEFDSSYKRGQPANFKLSQVVPCWTQAVQTMAEGGSAVVTCPAETAYGEKGIPGVIPPNSVLKFKIELLRVL